MSEGDRILGDALAAAEKDLFTGKANHRPWRLTQKRYPAYFATRSLDDAEAVRATLSLAERSGAVELVPHSRARPPHDIEAVRVMSARALAQYLGVALLPDQVARATQAFAPFAVDYPVLADILAAWARGAQVRRLRPDDAGVQALLDALSVVQARHDAAEDILLRRESIRLFGDSKRIEAIGGCVELLLSGELQGVDRTVGDAFAQLGLLHEPQPWLVSGDGEVCLDGRWVPLARPYLGLPASAVEGFRASTPPRCILTVENRQTFHEAAVQAATQNAWVIYTGGMPSPAWHGVYRMLLAGCPRPLPGVYHFGDTDVGGFRIAAKIAESARLEGVALKPWLMDPTDMQPVPSAAVPATPSQRAAMARAALDAGWDCLAARFDHGCYLVEQEGICLQWPDD